MLLKREVQQFVVEEICFTDTEPAPKGFCHFSLFKGHPCPPKPPKEGVNQVHTDKINFKKAEMAKTLRSGFSMSETDPLNHKLLNFVF